jgi:hypothetical protein
MPPAAHASTPAIASYAGKRMVKCGKNVAEPGMKLVTSPNEGRMPRLEIRPSGKDPRGYFSSAGKGGRGGAGPDPHTNHSRNFRLEDPPQFFGQIFWGKILVWTGALQSLCAHCHESRKKLVERYGYDKTIGLDGLPTDPRHPVYRN